MTSRSTTDGGRAYDRYWAVAHTRGRWVTASSASIAAARPTPPKRNPPDVVSGVRTGRRHRSGSAVASRPRKVRASTGGAYDGDAGDSTAALVAVRAMAMAMAAQA